MMATIKYEYSSQKSHFLFTFLEYFSSEACFIGFFSSLRYSFTKQQGKKKKKKERDGLEPKATKLALPLYSLRLSFFSHFLYPIKIMHKIEFPFQKKKKALNPEVNGRRTCSFQTSNEHNSSTSSSTYISVLCHVIGQQRQRFLCVANKSKFDRHAHKTMKGESYFFALDFAQVE